MALFGSLRLCEHWKLNTAHASIAHWKYHFESIKYYEYLLCACGDGSTHVQRSTQSTHMCFARLHSHYSDVDFCRFNLFKLLLVVGFFHSFVRLHCASLAILNHTLLTMCGSFCLLMVCELFFVHIWWRIEITKLCISDASDTMCRLLCVSSAKTGRRRKTAKIKLNGEFRLLWLKNYDARSGQRIFIKLMPNKLFPFLAECCCCGCRCFFF